ncbi:nuclear body associated kinase [Culex quinquefasciatus]|uniref:Nuclear body associated kinase n=1 Tax=Culex quinquefasciatus TaxID=7176 RepID=B0X091_CULQU|nr:nuclear body associated kinase [Culex quinquefasciatus]|eukprot:XP_001863063.1 nuclear body associated kinase [Culex quinquefasciatus]
MSIAGAGQLNNECAHHQTIYQIYRGRNFAGQVSDGRPEAFQHQVMSNILFLPGYQTIFCPTTHVIVFGMSMKPPDAGSPAAARQSAGVGLDGGTLVRTADALYERHSSERRQVAIVPSWPQQTGPHSLIVDSVSSLNVKEIYPKPHLNIQTRHEQKKDSPVQLKIRTHQIRQFSFCTATSYHYSKMHDYICNEMLSRKDKLNFNRLTNAFWNYRVG